jgi:hypothetical protein
MMAALRVFASIVVTILLIGCAEYEERAFIRKVLNKQQECPPPGMGADIVCHYLLTIVRLEGNTARGRVPKEAVEPNQKGCEMLRDELKEYPPSYVCPNAENFPAHEYEFQIDDPSTIKVGDTKHLVTVPGERFLKVAKEKASM